MFMTKKYKNREKKRYVQSGNNLAYKISVIRIILFQGRVIFLYFDFLTAEIK